MRKHMHHYLLDLGIVTCQLSLLVFSWLLYLSNTCFNLFQLRSCTSVLLKSSISFFHGRYINGYPLITSPHENNGNHNASLPLTTNIDEVIEQPNHSNSYNSAQFQCNYINYLQYRIGTTTSTAERTWNMEQVPICMLPNELYKPLSLRFKLCEFIHFFATPTLHCSYYSHILLGVVWSRRGTSFHYEVRVESTNFSNVEHLDLLNW